MQQFWGLDVDAAAHEIASLRLQSAKQEQDWKCHLGFTQRNYSEIKKVIREEDPDATADAILLDLGVSSMQVNRCQIFTHQLSRRVQDRGKGDFPMFKTSTLVHCLSACLISPL